jgi:hypothetical protein
MSRACRQPHADLPGLERDAFGWNRHREERSDAAIQESRGAYVPLDCFASLAMTGLVRPNRIAL